MIVFGVITRHYISQQTVTSSFGIVLIGVAVGLIAGLRQRSSSRHSPLLEGNSGLHQCFCTDGVIEATPSWGRRTACRCTACEQAAIRLFCEAGSAALTRVPATVACGGLKCTWHVFPADPARCARNAISQDHDESELATPKVIQHFGTI